MKSVSTIIAALFLCMTAQPVNAEDYGPNEVQHAMFNILFQIEVAAGIEHKASKAINELPEEGKQALYDSVDNKEKFVKSVNKSLERIKSAKETLDKQVLQVPDRSIEPLSASTPYDPNYPPESSVAYNIAKGLSLTTSHKDRCDGTGLEIYENAFYAAEKLADAGDAVCTGAGCDPTGLICLGACLVVEGYKLAVLTARVPLDACDKHGSGVDAAEIEAGYENSVRALNSFSTVLANQDNILKNQVDILANQGRSIGNQEEIIRLLKTPQGRRPDWNLK